ncbi:predicted protein [Nematostella vectensis]|uniref:Uncharacterized protein n=1 Tax=Nematostella vectensis TaxID=45351 RepID=A7S3D2_NEMVE|nr:predicted protein [Nematostella vectensis]|eukprot:XP_001633815.1 predicted protein [Nematostella vectensis]
MAADNDEGTGKHRKELRHRVQSFIRRPGDSSDDAEEYETFIPEDEEEEFIDEETAELAEEVMLYTSMERELLCETILGYLWWSLIFALPPMIWFYPLNELEISGYEAFVITIMTPVFTGIGAVLDFCRSLHGLAILRTLSLVGVASFQAPTTLTRLVLLAFGCGGAMLWFCGIVWSKKPSERSLCFWGLILGFFLMLAARALYISVNPVWSDNSSNKLCLILGIVATLDRVYTGYAKAATTESTPPSSSKDARVSGPGWVLVSLGFGALMFISHSVFSEVSIVSRWGVSGYPNVGASPNPWGSLSFWGLILGFFLMLAARALYISVNPVWSDNSSNKLCLILGIVATLDRVYTGYAKAATTESTPQSSSKDARVSGSGWVLVSLGFGALMFISHSVFSEVSIVSRWGVSGYPNVGASPNPWGAGVPLALALGVTLSTSSWTSSGAWSLVGVSGAAALYKAPGFGSYAGGLVLAVYVMSIWPAMIDRLFCRPSARTLALANLTYVILTLGSVWVVAYNFVPGGEYTRERTDVLLGVAMAFVGTDELLTGV